MKTLERYETWSKQHKVIGTATNILLAPIAFLLFAGVFWAFWLPIFFLWALLFGGGNSWNLMMQGVF